jgi:hypothetical protein
MKLVQILEIMGQISFHSFFSGMRNSKSARLRPKQPLEAVISEVAVEAAEDALIVAKKVICPG